MLSEQDYQNAANELGCEVSAVKAVAEVESAGAGFLPDGRPKVLYEAHLFSKFTGHKYDASHPNISSLKWNKKLYKSGAAEWDRFAEASALDSEAAMKSISLGKFQIVGMNYAACG